jgi:hypothetical protein
LPEVALLRAGRNSREDRGDSHPSEDDDQRQPLDEAANRRRNSRIREAGRGDKKERDG